MVECRRHLEAPLVPDISLFFCECLGISVFFYFFPDLKKNLHPRKFFAVRANPPIQHPRLVSIVSSFGRSPLKSNDAVTLYYTSVSQRAAGENFEIWCTFSSVLPLKIMYLDSYPEKKSYPERTFLRFPQGKKKILP